MAAEGCYLDEDDVDNWPDDATEAEKQAVIDKVEQLIDKVTETTWCETEFDIKLNGNGKDRLFVPLETDILSVTSILIDCIDLNSNWWDYDINSVFLDPCIGDDPWSKNYVADGEFRSWRAADPTHDLYYWSETTVATSTVNREVSDIYSGRYCCRLDIDADGHEASIEQTLSLTKNRKFRLQFYYKNSAIEPTNTTPAPLADSATATTLRDADIFDEDDKFNDCYVLIVSGKGTDNGFVQITDTIAIDGDIEVASWPGTQPDDTSRYIIVGTMKAKLYNPDLDEYLNISFPDDPVCRHLAEGAWEPGDEFFSLDPVRAWTLITIEFTSHADYIEYELSFTNDTAFSSSIYIDNVGIMSAGISAIAAGVSEGIFPRGYNNIEIIGTKGEGGSGDVPEAIKQAAVILAKWENDPSSEAAMGLMKSEKIGDYAYTNLAGAEEDVLTGVNKADILLRHYIKRKPILMAP